MAKLTKTLTTTLGKVKGLMLDTLRKGYTMYVYVADGYISVTVHKGSPDDKDYQSEAFSYYEYTALYDPSEKRAERSKDFISKIKEYIEANE